MPFIRQGDRKAYHAEWYRRRQAAKGKEVHGRRHGRPPAEGAVAVPVAAVRERDHAIGAERDLTSELMGDPQRGRSALERRNAGAAGAPPD